MKSHLAYIDFIKGIATISVILLHTIPDKVLYDTLAVYHIWQAVPVFIFISFYLGFRGLDERGKSSREYYSRNRIKKFLLKLWLPLIIFAVIEALYFFVIGKSDRVIGCLLCYNNGPGSYYIWCYMQIWLLLPLIYALLKRQLLVGGSILLVVSVLLDFLWERYVDLKPGCTCFRYLFLAIPSYMMLKGVEIKRFIPFVILSITYLAMILYSNLPNYADAILPDGWEFQTSLGYFYTFFLVVALSDYYGKMKMSKIKKYITHLGTISWEIFVLQMVLIGSGVLGLASSFLFDSVFLRVGFRVVAALVITLLLAELYKKILIMLKKC